MRLVASTGGDCEPDGGNPRAFALIAQAHPDFTLAQWRRFARFWSRMPRRRGGLVLIEDRRGYVHGLFRYLVESAREPSLTAKVKTLRIEDVIVVELPGAGLRKLIARCADQLARSLACGAIEIDAMTPAAALKDWSLAYFGYREANPGQPSICGT